MCCVCGFIHRDDRIVIDNKPYRAYKPHYHWTPKGGELQLDNIRYHATVCVACCGDRINWEEFYESRKRTSDEYVVLGSLNAVLPLRYEVFVSDLYELQCVYLRKSVF